MSFHQSAEDITLDGSILRARLRNVDGEWVDAELNLDEVLGNNNGKPLAVINTTRSSLHMYTCFE